MEKETREFQAEVLECREIHELPDGWPLQRLRALLTSLDIEDIEDADVPEMAVMALQDRELDEAAQLVLETVFGDAMRPGVRQNLVHDLGEERPWEEFADVAQQSGIFNAVVLLQRAFPRDFDRPDAVSVVARLQTGSPTGRGWLDATPPDAALLLRILAPGMDDRAVLRRLYENSLTVFGCDFPDARGIVWQATRQSAAAAGHEFELISSHQWLDPLSEAERFAARAWPDAPEHGSAPERSPA